MSLSERAALMNEYKTNRYLNHAHVLKIETMLDDNDNVILVTEKTECSLHEMLLWRGGTLSELEVSCVGRSLLKVLSYLQEKQVLHRSLCLEAVHLSIVVQEGAASLSVKVGMFGSATKADKQLRYSLAGTLQSPEMTSGLGYTYDCDQWAFGCIIY